MPESVSSLLGVEGSESLTQRADDDSLSAESLDSVSHGKKQKNKTDVSKINCKVIKPVCFAGFLH